MGTIEAKHRDKVMAKSTHTGTCAICERKGLKVSAKGNVANHGNSKGHRMSECFGSGLQALELGSKALLEVAEYWEKDEAEIASLKKRAENWVSCGDLNPI